MRKIDKCRADDSRKSGIALVVVLGFLSILVMLGVTFAIAMRTERLAARNYLEGVKGRQLIKVAMARAIDEVDADLVAGDLIYPDWYAFSSRSLSPSGTNINGLLNGVIEDYIPKTVALWEEATNQARLAEWVDVVVTNKDNKVEAIGRIGYVAVDCGGLLDGNMLGGQSRSYGTNANEITSSLNVLHEFNQTMPNSITNFVSRRNSSWKRFESLPEMYYLAYGTNTTTRYMSRYPSNVFVYSYFPRKQYLNPLTGTVADQVNIGGDVATVAGQRVAIQDQLATLSEFSGVDQRSAFYFNLIDFLDSDSDPGGGSGLMNTLATEPVPMINEVEIVNTVTVNPVGSASDVDNQFNFRVELWYPFLNANADSFLVEFGLLMPTFTLATPFQQSASAGGWPGSRFQTFTPPTPFIGRYSGVYPLGWPAQYGVRIIVRRASDNVIVDQLDLVLTGTDVLTGAEVVAAVPTQPLAIDPAETVGPKTFWKEADDPRLNWDWNNIVQWTGGGAASFGAENGAVTYSAAGKDGSWEMYVGNDGHLLNVGELGFLLYDETKPWETLPLMGPGRVDVLDLFTIETNDFRKGLVNPNSSNRAALASVFYDMAIGVPGAFEGRVGADDAFAIAEAFLTASGAQSFTNPADIGSVSPTTVGAILSTNFPVSSISKMGRESVIRHSLDLLSARQNLFVVVVAAQSGVDINGNDRISDDEVRSEARAMALVWRDPYPVSGLNRSFVRFFKWLHE